MQPVSGSASLCHLWIATCYLLVRHLFIMLVSDLLLPVSDLLLHCTVCLPTTRYRTLSVWPPPPHLSVRISFPLADRCLPDPEPVFFEEGVCTVLISCVVDPDSH
jgi:hypothetical protein